ncbi:hypothetical protein H9P43_007287 [Blastocladiella emersonii ATCC 22665]|nr:hypothetical protein H9P43_007287 [Blastocladiella emersonii ATCC 22665]
MLRTFASALRPQWSAASSSFARTLATAATPTAAAASGKAETAAPAAAAAASASAVPATSYVTYLAKSGGPYYALLEVKGRPYHVTRGDLLTLPRLKDVPLGAELVLDKVREIGSAEVTLRGAPFVATSLASVKAVVVEHWLSAKRQTVKTKRRKGYKRTHGHRQHLTSLRITDVAVQAPEVQA